MLLELRSNSEAPPTRIDEVLIAAIAESTSLGRRNSRDNLEQDAAIGTLTAELSTVRAELTEVKNKLGNVATNTEKAKFLDEPSKRVLVNALVALAGTIGSAIAGYLATHGGQ